MIEKLYTKSQKTKIAIFSNDAGGSNLLLELLKFHAQNFDFQVFCLGDSPCYKLCLEKNLQAFLHPISSSRSEIFRKLELFAPDVLLYSTGWQNKIEHLFLEYAKLTKIPSISFLDHWTNYKERFGFPHKEWRKNLPDFIATHDEVSYHLAQKLGLDNVISVENYAFKTQLQEAKELSLFLKPRQKTLLFLTEPIATFAKKTYQDAYHFGFTEKEVYEEILHFQKELGYENLIIRLHPSDTPDMYTNMNKEATFSSSSLVQDILKADLVIGSDTVALYTAYHLQKKVISYIPSKQKKCSVPIPLQNQFNSLRGVDLNTLQTLKTPTKPFGINFAFYMEKILESKTLCKKNNYALCLEQEVLVG